MWTSTAVYPSLPLPISAPRRRRRRHLPTTCSSSTDPLTAAGRLLWGRALPPQPLITAVRTAWSASWHLMMRQLAPSDPSGTYSRPSSAFPSVPTPHPDPQNLRLYAALPCPWAHRALIVRALRFPALPVSLASPGADGSWELGPDGANGPRTLREVYGTMRGGYDGRSTVPMLWDAERKEVVCNESYGIIEFLNTGFHGGEGPDLSPVELKGEIDKWNQIIYPNVNNGVYRCGFAQSQEAYDNAVNQLFDTLDMLDSHLSGSRYLCGNALTLADVCLFTTMIRFDLVYNVLFKCTKKKLVEYPNLHGYTRDIYQIPKVADTCDFEAIMGGYYGILFPLNPSSIRPVIPSVCEHESLFKPHNRELLSQKDNHLQMHLT